MDGFNITIQIDLSEATKDFFRSLFGSIATTQAPAVAALTSVTQASAPEAAKPEAAKPEATKPAPEAKPEAPATSISIDDVRSLLTQKVNAHRAEIKAKLSALGAPNVTSLDPSKYAEMFEFLKNLA